MHIVLGVLGAIVAASFWYYRIKMVAGAANDVADAALRARGAWRRRQFRQRADGAALSTIDDPLTAAAVMMVAVAGAHGHVSDDTKSALQDELEKLVGSAAAVPDDLAVFAVWIGERGDDPNDLSRRFAPLWTKNLTSEQRGEFLGAVRRVAQVQGDLSDLQIHALESLQQKLLR